MRDNADELQEMKDKASDSLIQLENNKKEIVDRLNWNLNFISNCEVEKKRKLKSHKR